MKNNILILILLLLAGISKAQKQEDITIFTAMNDEQLRSLNNLALPMMSKPFYIAYTVSASRQYSVKASLGAVISSIELPYSLMGSAAVLLGGYDLTSDSRYMGQFLTCKLGCEPDYNEIRRGFWSCSDEAYKLSLEENAAKRSYLEANPYEKTAGLPDLMPTKGLEKLVEPRTPFVIDLKQAEQLARELSAIFKKYPQIIGSEVSLQGADMTFYKLTTEDVIMKQPLSFVEFYMQGSIMTSVGEAIRDTYIRVYPTPQSLPDMEKLRSEVTGFAEGLIKLKEADVIGEDYSGPVLLEDEAVQAVFAGNLLGEEGICAHRSAIAAEELKPTLEGKIGKKVLDTRLTVKNYSTRSEYHGMPLIGAYEIDAEGVVPAAEEVLIDKGVVKKLLNGQVPTDKVRYSTGSSRFLPIRTDVIYTTVPGTLEITADKGLKPEAMRKALIKAAKEKKLDYAYIVRKLSGEASRIYRVDVKSGEETQVRFGKLSPLNWTKLKNLAEISSAGNAYNFFMNGGAPGSIICPSSILIPGMDITQMKTQKTKLPVLKYPLQRQVSTND